MIAHRTCITALILLAVGSSPSPAGPLPSAAAGQQAPPPGLPGSSQVEETGFARADGLLPLAGRYASVWYPAEHLDRAAHLFDRLELTGRELHRWRRAPLDLELQILDRSQWQEKGLARPYGLPSQLPGGGLAVAALGDPGTVRLWEELLGQPVPPIPGRPLRGTREEATSLVFCDALLQLEIGRSYAREVGFASDAARWPGEVIGHLATATFLDRYDSGQRELLDRLLARRQQDVGRRALDHFDETLGIEDWLAYQSRFRDAADRIRQRDGAHALPRLQRKLQRGKLEPAALLLSEYPELGEWLAATFSEDRPVSSEPD